MAMIDLILVMGLLWLCCFGSCQDGQKDVHTVQQGDVEGLEEITSQLEWQTDEWDHQTRVETQQEKQHHDDDQGQEIIQQDGQRRQADIEDDGEDHS